MAHTKKLVVDPIAPTAEERSDFELSVFAAIVAALYVAGWAPWAPPALIAVDVAPYLPLLWVAGAAPVYKQVATALALKTATWLFTNVVPAALVTKAVTAVITRLPTLAEPAVPVALPPRRWLAVGAQIVPGIRRRASSAVALFSIDALADRRSLVLAIVPLYRRYGHIDPLTLVKLIQHVGGADSEYKNIVEAFVRANLHSHHERPSRFFNWLLRYHRSVAQVDAAAAEDAAVAVSLPAAHDYAGIVNVLRAFDELPYLAINFRQVLPYLVAADGPLGSVPSFASQFHAIAVLTDFNLFLTLQIYDANLWQLCPADMPGKPSAPARATHQLRDGSEPRSTYDLDNLKAEWLHQPSPQLDFTVDDGIATIVPQVQCPLCEERVTNAVTTDNGTVCSRNCFDSHRGVGSDPVANPTLDYVITVIDHANDKPQWVAGVLV